MNIAYYISMIRSVWLCPLWCFQPLGKGVLLFVGVPVWEGVVDHFSENPEFQAV